MVDSDHSEREEVDSKLAPAEVLSDPLGSTNKRPREESSDDEKVTVPNKKLRTSPDNEVPAEESEKVPTTELNGSVKVKEEPDDTKCLDNGQNVEVKSSLTEKISVKEEMQDEKSLKSDEKSNASIYKNGTTSDNASIPTVPTSNIDSTQTSEEDEDGEKSVKEEKDKDTDERKYDSTNALVVDGLELKVECASDEEASSPESEQDKKDVKPRVKVAVVIAEPNESELEVSPSDGEHSSSGSEHENDAKPRIKVDATKNKSNESERDVGPSDGKKSDRQVLSDSVANKQTTKKESAKEEDTLEEKSSASEEESLNSNSDDEDYSPRTKKKMKKSPAGRKAVKSTPSKRGRGGRRGAAQRKRVKEQEQHEEEDDASPTDKTKKTTPGDKKTPRKRSHSKSSGDNSEVESEDDKTSGTDGKQKKSSAKPETEKRIQALKKYINVAGITVRYQVVWAHCKSNSEKIQRLKEILEENGVKGRPSLEKCRKAKKKNERLRDASELDTSNIISEGRVTRARRNMDSNSKPSPVAGTPPRYREARNTLKKIRCVIDSDDSE